MKQSYKPEELCVNLPMEIMEFFLYCKNLDFEQEPDYKYCYSLFNNSLMKYGYSNDLIFSWIEDSKIKDKLLQMKNKRNRNIGLPKRKSSPQTRLYHILLNTSESQTSMQRSKIFNTLNNSKSNYYLSKSYKSPLNRSLLASVNSIINDDISNKNRIIKSKLDQRKYYRKLFVSSISNINTSSSEKKISVNTLSNLQKYINIKPMKNTKKKPEMKITLFKLKPNLTSRNERKNIISYNNINNISTKKNSINNITLDYNININNNKNYYQTSDNNLNKFSKINNNEKINFIKVIQNNIINGDNNMIINSNSKKDKRQNNRKIVTINTKPTIKVGLKDLLLKYKLRHLNQKLISKNFCNFLKPIDMTYKTLENTTRNENKISESKYLNTSGKNHLNIFTNLIQIQILSQKVT